MNTLTIAELVDRENHAWEELKELLDSGQNTYVYVPAKQEVGEDTLYRLSHKHQILFGSCCL